MGSLRPSRTACARARAAGHRVFRGGRGNGVAHMLGRDPVRDLTPLLVVELGEIRLDRAHVIDGRGVARDAPARSTRPG